VYLKERDGVEDIDIDGSFLFKRILKKYYGRYCVHLAEDPESWGIF
jgi:hypothetical protein